MTHCSKCYNCPSFNFGSSIITIIVGALAFITALAWNELTKHIFDEWGKDEDQETMARFNYALLATSIAIVVAFLLMYYVEGTKW